MARATAPTTRRHEKRSKRRPEKCSHAQPIGVDADSAPDMMRKPPTDNHGESRLGSGNAQGEHGGTADHQQRWRRDRSHHRSEADRTQRNADAPSSSVSSNQHRPGNGADTETKRRERSEEANLEDGQMR